jgi:hypothetical protein
MQQKTHVMTFTFPLKQTFSKLNRKKTIAFVGNRTTFFLYFCTLFIQICGKLTDQCDEQLGGAGPCKIRRRKGASLQEIEAQPSNHGLREVDKLPGELQIMQVSNSRLQSPIFPESSATAVVMLGIVSIHNASTTGNIPALSANHVPVHLSFLVYASYQKFSRLSTHVTWLLYGRRITSSFFQLCLAFHFLGLFCCSPFGFSKRFWIQAVVLVSFGITCFTS